MGQHSAAQDAQLHLAYYRCELAGPRHSFNLDQLAERMGKPRRDAALHVDASRRILNEKIGCGRIHRDHTTDEYRIAERSLLRTQSANLIGMRKNRQDLPGRRKLSSGFDAESFCSQ